MRLYYSKGACSLACRIIINELNIDCSYTSVNLRTKKTETEEDFLEINPKGAVPVLITNNNEVLTENTVIQQYLADTYKALQLLPEVGNLKRYRVLEWLNFISTELHKGMGILFNPILPQSIKEEYFYPIIYKKLAYVNQELTSKTYLLEDHFTLPDSYLFVILLWCRGFKLDMEEYPQLQRYFDDLKNYPAVAKSLQEEHITI